MDAQVLRANALAGLRQLDAAVSAKESAIAYDPERARGTPASAPSKWSAATGPAPRPRSRRPCRPRHHSATHLALANYYWAVRRRQEAETELKAALAISPRSALANRAIAYFYVGSGRSELAEPYLKAVADLTPDATGKLALAAYYVSRNRTNDARTVLEQVVADGRDSVAAARIQLASLDMSTGDVAAATKRVDDVLARERRTRAR